MSSPGDEDSPNGFTNSSLFNNREHGSLIITTHTSTETRVHKCYPPTRLRIAGLTEFNDSLPKKDFADYFKALKSQPYSDPAVASRGSGSFTHHRLVFTFSGQRVPFLTSRL